MKRYVPLILYAAEANVRLLILSDSHNAAGNFIWAIENEPRAEKIIFLGDGLSDAAEASDETGRSIICVRGNCDFFSREPDEDIITAGGTKIFLTHGHLYSVKHSLSQLTARARGLGANIALFGHTHSPLIDYDDGLYLFNPGSLRGGSYGVIDITSAGIVPVLKTLPRIQAMDN